MSKYLDKNGLIFVWQKIKAALALKVDAVSGKGLSTNDYTTEEKAKLAGIATGANKTTVDSALSSSSTNPVQNKVINTALGGKVDAVSGKGLSTNDYTSTEKDKLAGIEAGANKYTLPTASSSTLGGVKVGTNLSISSGVLSATDTTYSPATTSADGLMSSSDKTKLNGIATGANKYVLPAATASSLGGIKVGENLSVSSDGTLSAVQGTYTLPIASSSTLGGIKVGTNLSINSSTGVLSATDTKYSKATSSADGLMAKEDKSKLDAFGAASTYALKTDIAGMYKFKGSVATYADLPSGASVGDVYDVQSNGQNYAWTGTAWDSLGEVFSIETITNSEIDEIFSDV